MTEPGICCRSVIMFYTRFNIYHIPRMQNLRLFAPLLIYTLAGGTDKDLSTTFVCVMNMPVIPASRLKCDINGCKKESPTKYCAYASFGAPIPKASACSNAALSSYFILLNLPYSFLSCILTVLFLTQKNRYYNIVLTYKQYI